MSVPGAVKFVAMLYSASELSYNSLFRQTHFYSRTRDFLTLKNSYKWLIRPSNSSNVGGGGRSGGHGRRPLNVAL